MKKFSLVVFSLMFLSELTAQPEKIKFELPLFYPEGIVYDEAGKRFFVGSVKTGTIAAVKEDGSASEFYKDSTLCSSFGLKIDAKRKKLWICSTDPKYSQYTTPSTRKKLIKLVSVDLAKAQKIDEIDLSSLFNGNHFANDLTLDDDGNLYITDSYSPVIYKIDTKGKASLFAQSDHFKAADIGLNGIIYKKGYLLAINNGNGQLLKIDLKDPSKIIALRQDVFFPGGDGLIFDGQGNLLLVQNRGINKVHQLSSQDEWASATLKNSTALTDRMSQPSTLTKVGNSFYVLNSKLNELSDPTAIPSREFIIQKVNLPVQQ